MPIELGDLHLTKIHNVRTLEQSKYVYHKIPGLNGVLSQDTGRDSLRLVIEGIFYGDTSKDVLEKLRTMHTAREPVDFVADITGSVYSGRVLLDTFEVKENAGEPDQYSYVLFLSEYIKPPKQELDALAISELEKGIGLEAAALMDIAALPDMLSLGNIPEISNPLEPLEGALGPVQEAVKGLTNTLSGLAKLFEDKK